MDEWEWFLCMSQFTTAVWVWPRREFYHFHHPLTSPEHVKYDRRAAVHKMPRPLDASAALHCGFSSWLLHLKFEDKRSWLICLLHVSVASGPRAAERWNAFSFSFIPSTAAKSLLNKKTDGVKVRGFSQQRKCLVTCTSLLERSVSETLFAKITVCILHFNIIIHGQSLRAVGIHWCFRVFKLGAFPLLLLLLLWHSCLHWITVETIFMSYLSAFAGVSFVNPTALTVEPDMLNSRLSI